MIYLSKNKSYCIMKTIGERIRAIRKEKNLKQGELARKLKMTSAQLCRIEGSKNAPSIKTLARIAKALDMTLAELMEDNQGAPPITMGDSSGNSRTYANNTACSNDGMPIIPIRNTDDLTDETTNILKQVTSTITQYVSLESDLGIRSATTLPLRFTFSQDEHGAEILARALRAACESGTAPFVNLPAILEAKHIRIVLVKTSPEIQSRSFYDTDNHIVAIALNRTLPPERQLYRIAYELGYVCIFGAEGFSTVIEKPFTHKFVRRFAAAFLMPEEAINILVAQLALGPMNWTMKMLLQLKYRFGVNAETFAHRLEKLGVLAPSLRKRFKEELRVYYEEHNNTEPPPTIKPFETDSMLKLLKLRSTQN